MQLLKKNMEWFIKNLIPANSTNAHLNSNIGCALLPACIVLAPASRAKLRRPACRDAGKTF